MKKFFNYLLMFALLLQVTICVSSCENVPGGNDGNGDDNDTPTSTTVLNEDESKEELEKIAKELMDEFKASDFEGILDLAEYIAQECVEYEVDEEMLDDLLESFVNKDYKGEEEDEYGYQIDIYEVVYKLSNVKGKFVANEKTKRLEKEDADNFSLHITDQNGNPCEVALTTSGKTKTVYCWNDYHYISSGWDENDNYYYEEELEKIYVEVPETATLVMKQNGNKLLEFVINTDLSSMAGSEFNLENDQYSVSATAYFNGYSINVDKITYKNNTEAKVSVSFKHGDKNLITAKATATPDIENKYDEEWDEEYIEANCKDNTVKVSILNNLRIEGTCKNYLKALEAFADEKYDGDVAKREEMINKSLNINLFFNNSSKASAKIEIECEEEKEYYEWDEEYYYYQEYIPVIVFNDDSRNSLEDFFNEYDFEETIEAFETLINEFEEMFYGYDFGL